MPVSVTTPPMMPAVTQVAATDSTFRGFFGSTILGPPQTLHSFAAVVLLAYGYPETFRSRPFRISYNTESLFIVNA